MPFAAALAESLQDSGTDECRRAAAQALRKLDLTTLPKHVGAALRSYDDRCARWTAGALVDMLPTGGGFALALGILCAGREMQCSVQ